jgi:hypothetical protein
MTDKKMPKNAVYFVCETCDFKCSKQSNYYKHLLTLKHQNADKMLTTADGKNAENAEKYSTINGYICECGKEYKHRQSLFIHKKKCLIFNKKEPDKNEDLINYLIKENQEFKSLILEIVKKDNTINNNTMNNNTINSHNKTFNLQFFLNETCKNAMNITDFVDSIKLQLSDLENVAKIGYVEGLSKIIIKNLNALDVTERPVHCSDSKRDTMYVKDEDKWEKESEDNHKVLKAIEDIADKNRKMVKEWKSKNPECASSKSHKADVYSHIMIEAVCSNNDTNNNKILKKIAKEVTIDKANNL